MVVDSKKFSDAKGASFPITVSLYQLDKKGTGYEYIKNLPFQLEDGRKFSLNSFQFLTDLVNKYPKKTLSDEYLNNLFFFTFRDINSVMRNKTFIQEFNNYSVEEQKRISRRGIRFFLIASLPVIFFILDAIFSVFKK